MWIRIKIYQGKCKTRLGTINSNGKKIEGKTIDIADADEAADIIKL